MEFSNNKQRKKKSLKLKVAHLKLEVEERKEELDSYSEEFIRTMNKISDLISAAIPQEDLNQPTIIDKTTDNEEFQPVDDGKPDLPEDIKKIWKKIAAITHPDKTKDNPELTEIYKKAVGAWERKDSEELLLIALELDIEIPEMPEEVVVKNLESVAQNLQKKVSEIENSVLLQWGRADFDLKLKIMNIYLHSKGYKPKT
jgi:hypothetical protein